MSIVNQNDINPSQSEDPSIISLKNLIDKIPHALSRNVRRASSPTQVNQYSTKEGTPIKPIESKTIDCLYNINKNNDSISSNHQSNISQIFERNKYSYRDIRDKIPGSSAEQSKGNNFVYNMLRANHIKKRISDDMKISSNESAKKITKKTKSNTSSIGNNTSSKKSTKEKISCCFFFK